MYFPMAAVLGCEHDICHGSYFDAVELNPQTSQLSLINGKLLYLLKASNALWYTGHKAFLMPIMIDCLIYSPVKMLIVKVTFCAFCCFSHPFPSEANLT
jgi:hypothetical protein